MTIRQVLKISAYGYNSDISSIISFYFKTRILIAIYSQKSQVLLSTYTVVISQSRLPSKNIVKYSVAQHERDCRTFNHRQLVRSIPRLSAPSCHLLGKISAMGTNSLRDIYVYSQNGQPLMEITDVL